jgi:uncharacterized protein YggT (Ycf19 family)
MAMMLVVLQYAILLAGMFLLAQLIVGLFNWNRRHQNVIYGFFAVLTRPFVRLTRAITPRIVVDQHVPMVTFLLLFFAYFVVVILLYKVCLSDLTQLGCERLLAQRQAGAAQ